MPVYVITHTIYSYNDHDYETTVEVFKSYSDALIYFDMIKSNVIIEYEKYTSETIDTLNQWDEFYMYDSTYDLDTSPCKRIMSISLDDYGNDFISIKEKTIMAFEEA